MFEKVRRFFTKTSLYALDNYNLHECSISFSELDNEILMDISDFIRNNLVDSEKISDRKCGLKKSSSLKCNNIDSLILELRSIIEHDYSVILRESIENDWNFQYFMNKHFLNDSTIALWNQLSDKNGKIGDIRYNVLTVRKHNDNYYIWDNS